MNRNQANDSESVTNEFLFVGDADNLTHIDDWRGYIHVLAFSRLLQYRGVSEALLIGNWFSPMEERLWSAAGVECIETHCNADDLIAETLRDHVKRGAKRVLLGSGDGHAFAGLVAELTAQGVEIHVLSNRSCLSRELRAAATGYAYSDRFVHRRIDDTLAEAA